LECASLGDAVTQATSQDVEDPRELIAAQAAASAGRHRRLFFRLDEEFHARLMAVGRHDPRIRESGSAASCRWSGRDRASTPACMLPFGAVPTMHAGS
jgi:hypothetical protein